MTKAELIALAQISLTGGTPSADSRGKFHDLVVEKYVGMAYNDLVSQTKDSKVLDQFCVVYRNVDVLTDSELGLRYIPLNVGLINTVQGSAVRSITPMKDQTTNIYVRGNHTQGAYVHLEVTYFFSKYGSARVEADRIYLDDVPEDITEVLLKILPSFEDIADDDEFQMPGGKDGLVFKMVIDYARVLYETPEAYKNDNNVNSK